MHQTQRGIVGLILLFLIVLAGIGAGGMYVWQKNQQSHASRSSGPGL